MSRTTVDEVVGSSTRLQGRTPAGARAIAKKIGHAKSAGYSSAFEGIAPIQINADVIIRQTLQSLSRVFVGEKVIDVYNAAGQGVRFDKVTNEFMGFLEEALAVQ